MRLFGLQAKVEHVGQLLIQQINHRTAYRLAQIVLSWNEFGFHIGVMVSPCGGSERVRQAMRRWEFAQRRDKPRRQPDLQGSARRSRRRAVSCGRQLSTA